MPRLLATLVLAFTLLNGHAQSLDAETRAGVLQRTIAQIRDGYVDPSAANKIEAALRDGHAAVDEPMDGEEFAKRLTTLMQSVVPDRHLHVEYSAKALPQEAVPTTSELALRRLPTSKPTTASNAWSDFPATSAMSIYAGSQRPIGLRRHWPRP